MGKRERERKKERKRDGERKIDSRSRRKEDGGGGGGMGLLRYTAKHTAPVCFLTPYTATGLTIRSFISV